MNEEDLPRNEGDSHCSAIGSTGDIPERDTGRAAWQRGRVLKPVLRKPAEYRPRATRGPEPPLLQVTDHLLRIGVRVIRSGVRCPEIERFPLVDGPVVRGRVSPKGHEGLPGRRVE